MSTVTSMTRADIEAVLEKEPHLTDFGIGSYARGRGWLESGWKPRMRWPWA